MMQASPVYNQLGLSLLIRRIAARLVDALLMIALAIVLFIFGYLIFSAACTGDDTSSSCMIVGSLGTAVAFSSFVAPIIYDFQGLVIKQSTRGKSTLRLRVVYGEGSAPGWRQCLARTLAFWLSIPGPVVGLIYSLTLPLEDVGWKFATVSLATVYFAGMIIFARRKHRFFHDWIAGTYVVRA